MEITSAYHLSQIASGKTGALVQSFPVSDGKAFYNLFLNFDNVFVSQEEYRVKKAAAYEGGTCNSLTSAMALGSLSIYVRALLETDQAFQYDVLP